MENPFFNRLGSVLWVGLVILIVTLAIYVSVGRLVTANLAGFRTEILQAMNARLPFAIEAEQVSGEWQSFTPAIVLTELRISIPGSASPPLALSRGRIGLDVLNSLRTRSLQLTRLELNGLSLRGELSRNGRFKLTGLGEGTDQTASPLREFLLNIEQITLLNNRLILTLPGGEVREMGLDLQLTREGSQRRAQATLSSSTGARISVLAQGLGDPFKPAVFTGQVYLDMESTDLGAIKDLFAKEALPVWADGAVDLELWLSWDRGKPSVVARLEGDNLVVAPQDASWQLPLQHVALDARLLERSDRWTLFVSNLEVENAGVEWALSRLQLDSWGNALRVRTSNVSLQPINAIIVDQDSVSKKLRDVFSALRPRGSLSALQVSTNDIYQPWDDWNVEANFENVAVDSLHGAPGITAATGYTQIAENGGIVVLDGQSMSLDFPAIYREPLHFDDLHGTLHLGWDTRTVRLTSGLLTTEGEEGTAKVLFGLRIPLQPDDIGIEMDLLVGLQDTHAVHRVKYIPYILDPSLLTWLADSIGDGYIEQGAFLWRGSLRQGAAPLRTVQLAFNIADTQLSYHPRWPPVLVEQGIVLIDDSNVSVWADQASLFGSSVDQLSVETRVNAAKQITLELQGRVRGPVTDGFKVLKESPLADIVGPTFTAWTATGSLETDLQIHLNLSDKSVAPQVEVNTHWRDVDLLVTPGNLPLQAVNGEFDYSTTTGFGSSGLVGTLWGKAVSANLRQQHELQGGVYDPATTVLDIELATEVDIADLRRWLQLDDVAFASGQAAADLDIRLTPGAPPVLTVNSDLLGVELDLPHPWQKSAAEPQHLRLEMPLAQGVMPLTLDLGEQLHLRLAVDGGVVRGAALGINEAAPATEEGVLRVTGQAPLIEADEWLGLVKQYFNDDASVGAKPAGAAEQSTAGLPADTSGAAQQPSTEASAGLPFDIVVDGLRVDTVVFLGQELQNVVFSLARDRTQWALSLGTDWLRGALSRGAEGGPLQLVVDYFDLDQLPDFKPSGGAGGGDSSWDLPEVDVTLSNLFQSERRLGELSFVLHSQANVITAEQITGKLANLRLRVEQPGKLIWHRGPEAYSELQAVLNFEDLGQTLEYFDYQRILETHGGDFQIELRWPGAPQDFALADAKGTMQVRIDQGSFLEAPPGATGALRVASILNLPDIVRRLSLSNMFESGIPFDSVHGEVDVGDGNLYIARIEVKGSSSFQFSGVSDVQTKSIDGEVVAILPVASNLPWIAALAASLPVAAGVYVVSQVFNKQMNRLSSAVYTIGGTWNDPEVNFDRIFDNTSGVPVDAKAESAAAKTVDAPASVQPVSP